MRARWLFAPRRRKARSSSPWIGCTLGVPRLLWGTCRRPVQLDPVPLKIAGLGGPKTVAIGDQDHGGVAMTIAARFASDVD